MARYRGNFYFIFFITPHLISLRMIIFQIKSCRKSKDTFNQQLLFTEIRAVYEMWKNKVQRDGNIIRRMRTARWITKATDTNTECVILSAFPLQ